MTADSGVQVLTVPGEILLQLSEKLKTRPRQDDSTGIGDNGSGLRASHVVSPDPEHHHHRERNLLRVLVLVRTLQGATLFLMMNTAVVLALYGIGNYQSFLESTQLMLLEMLSYLGLMILFVSLYFVLAVILMMFIRRRWYLGKLLIGISAAVFGGGVSAAVSFLTAFLLP